MHIIHSLHDAKNLKLHTPVILTIGNFEGVHKGHQALLKQVVDLAHKHHKTAALITFSNHPTEILNPNNPTPLLCTTDHKLSLFKKAGIDLVILLPFTKDFSQQSAEAFLENIQENLPFQDLLLGSDAHIGKNREGNPTTIAALAKKIGFTVDYFPDINFESQRISSSRIRACIHKGDFKDAELLLGRPYSIMGTVIKGTGRGTPIGFPTANIAVDKLCLPPYGVYAVTLAADNKSYKGVANLGVAPTVHQERTPMLEVHLFDTNVDLYGKTVDVILHTYIRPEKRFESLDALKAQIAMDVTQAKQSLEPFPV